MMSTVVGRHLRVLVCYLEEERGMRSGGVSSHIAWDIAGLYVLLLFSLLKDLATSV